MKIKMCTAGYMIFAVADTGSKHFKLNGYYHHYHYHHHHHHWLNHTYQQLSTGKPSPIPDCRYIIIIISIIIIIIIIIIITMQVDQRNRWEILVNDDSLLYMVRIMIFLV